ncbi:hypothetical protein [Alistipes sp.]|uniref:hypothetical protein n=1 Tax=Alistipes sp. TaxID=1872444 RepID=UPI0025C3C407|nr:hypothetical protein [Alistipes sp.]
MSEHVRPRHFAHLGVEVIEPSALQLGTDTGNRMHPFGQRQVALETKTFAAGARVITVGKGRTGSETGRNLPIIPKSVRNKPGNARFLRRFLGKYSRGECHKQKSKESFFHVI